VSTLHLADGKTTTTATQCAHTAVEPCGCDLLVVDFAGSPRRWLDDWRTTIGDPPRATFVLSDAAAWAAGHPRDQLESVAAPATTVRTEFVGSPGNLTDLGVTVLERLETCDERDPRTVLCCQSLSVLLQYSASQEVYQFLHTLVGHLEQFDATAHFHLHENAHEETTVAELRPLFDRIRRDGDA
jgi:hypothetical protein